MKVIIVDDEINVGNLIKNLIEWDQLGLELIGVYQNGFDVLEKFKTDPADILICDIEMPEITGLDLIARISSEYPSTECVIISGFRNFEYARQAMQYGVDHYILKPIDEDELNSTLRTISKATAKERERTRAERNAFFFEVQSDTYQPTTLTETNRKYGFNFYAGTFFCVKIVGTTKEAADPIVSFLMTKIPLMCHDVEFYGRGKYIVSALVNLNASATRDDVFELLQEAIDYTNQPVHIFMGPDFTDVNLLAEENATMDRATWQRLFLPARAVYRVTTKPAGRLENLTESESNRLTKAVEGMDEEVFSKLIREIFYERQQQLREHPQLVEELTGTVAMATFNKMYNLGVRSNDFSETRDALGERVDQAVNLDGVIAALSEILFRDIKNKLVVYNDEESDYIRQAKNYIQKNYNQNISLESLAKELRLNQTYVSSVFKDGTGINFKQFLTDVRIDNAKRLLRETNMNISQIANEVGYKNAFYFTNTFTSHEGIKPQEYRRIHRSFK